MLESRTPSYLRRFPGGVAIHSRTDGREGHGPQPVLQRQLQGAPAGGARRCGHSRTPGRPVLQ